MSRIILKVYQYQSYFTIEINYYNGKEITTQIWTNIYNVRSKLGKLRMLLGQGASWSYGPWNSPTFVLTMFSVPSMHDILQLMIWRLQGLFLFPKYSHPYCIYSIDQVLMMVFPGSSSSMMVQYSFCIILFSFFKFK